MLYIGFKPKFDIPIELDYSDVNYSYRDIRGRQGQRMVRLTPLEWTSGKHTSIVRISLVKMLQVMLMQYFRDFGTLKV